MLISTTRWWQLLAWFATKLQYMFGDKECSESEDPPPMKSTRAVDIKIAHLYTWLSPGSNRLRMTCKSQRRNKFHMAIHMLQYMINSACITGHQLYFEHTHVFFNSFAANMALHWTWIYMFMWDVETYATHSIRWNNFVTEDSSIQNKSDLTR